MDCVEVVPLHDLLHRRGAEAQRNGRRPQRNDSEGHASDGTPERPFMPRVMRERLERDEIVPETPDALLRPARMSLLTDQESGLDNDSPTKLLSKAQPLIRLPTTPTHLVAALQDVHDMLSRPGLSQIPAEELADSAQLLDPENRQLRRALA
ncbi:hypothetical protein BC826DRAFT_632676 [Russula brevipes]|nr:hypothetical protein BC826DRAFT_632676 [Russula brevipes]